MDRTLEIGFLIYPGVTQLDCVSASEVLAFIPNANTQMVWKAVQPITTDRGFVMVPNVDFENCPDLDVICVPGGMEQLSTMGDAEVMAFLRRQGQQAQYVASVCTGSLMLGAAGLLEGYRSACHWAFLDLLEAFGAIPSGERVVVDRNRFSGAGVTSGIDLALTLAAAIAGDNVAKQIQLALQYDPQPPFDAGAPAAAGPALVSKVCHDLTAALPDGWEAKWNQDFWESRAADANP